MQRNDCDDELLSEASPPTKDAMLTSAFKVLRTYQVSTLGDPELVDYILAEGSAVSETLVVLGIAVNVTDGIMADVAIEDDVQRRKKIQIRLRLWSICRHFEFIGVAEDKLIRSKRTCRFMQKVSSSGWMRDAKSSEAHLPG